METNVGSDDRRDEEDLTSSEGLLVFTGEEKSAKLP
jgi:hypothetical protein